jgi:tyrosinase
VHVLVGGFSGWMGAVKTAAQDPIFYLHHANCDRLWDQWLSQGGRSNPLSNNAPDPAWKTTVFTFFDENGKQVTMTACDVLRAAQQLNYTYEEECTQVNQFCLTIVNIPPHEVAIYAILRSPILTNKAVSIPLPPLDKLISATSTGTLSLQLDNVTAPTQPGVIWEVYVGPTNATLGSNSPYYVGNVALFGPGVLSAAKAESMPSEPASFTYRINTAVLASARGPHGTATDVQVTFVPRSIIINGRPSLPKPASKVTIDSAMLTLTAQPAATPTPPASAAKRFDLSSHKTAASS